MNVSIETMPELRVGAVRHVGSYMDINSAFAKLGEIVARAGVQKRADMLMLAIYYDDPQTTPAPKLRSDAALSFPRNAKLPHELAEQTIPGGRYARMTHVGPYQTLGDAWSRLIREWLPTSGERMGTSGSYEIYRNSPESTPPQDLRTDLYIPLQ
ncbi:MAG TPA: GyrI-like domain-containing protein [Gemmatimonadales bacterium]|nr:GyrI-like domain-containing protein [Gemmatimonadales bacterium]